MYGWNVITMSCYESNEGSYVYQGSNYISNHLSPSNYFTYDTCDQRWREWSTVWLWNLRIPTFLVSYSMHKDFDYMDNQSYTLIIIHIMIVIILSDESFKLRLGNFKTTKHWPIPRIPTKSHPTKTNLRAIFPTIVLEKSAKELIHVMVWNRGLVFLFLCFGGEYG